MIGERNSMRRDADGHRYYTVFDVVDRWKEGDLHPSDLYAFCRSVTPLELGTAVYTFDTKQDWAHTAARGVLADLGDRWGIKQELSRNIDEETRKEIVESLAAIIREAGAGKT